MAAQHELLAHTVIMEVTLAHQRLSRATRSRARIERSVLPALETTLNAAKHGYESGDENHLIVLEVLRRTGEARLQKIEMIAEQRRARCELERAIGAQLERAPQQAARAETSRGKP